MTAGCSFWFVLYSEFLYMDAVGMTMEDSEQALVPSEASSSHQTSNVGSQFIDDSSDDERKPDDGATYKAIINYVKDIPVLWQRSHLDFGRVSVLGPIWEKMSRDIQIDEYTLKQKWKHMKDRFRKIYRKLLINPKAEITWKYYKDLSFLLEDYFNEDIVLRTKDKIAMQCSDKDEESSNESSSDSTKAKKNKDDALTRKSTNSCQIQKTNHPNDSDYMYLLSILPQIRNLTEMQKLEFRVKVHDWLLELYYAKT